jgi:hypothetical protein
VGNSGSIGAHPASDLFRRDDGPSGFEKVEQAAPVIALARAAGNVSRAAGALVAWRVTLYGMNRRALKKPSKWHLQPQKLQGEVLSDPLAIAARV